MFIQTLEISCSKAIEKDSKDNENSVTKAIFNGSLNLFFLIYEIKVANSIKPNTQNTCGINTSKITNSVPLIGPNILYKDEINNPVEIPFTTNNEERIILEIYVNIAKRAINKNKAFCLIPFVIILTPAKLSSFVPSKVFVISSLYSCPIDNTLYIIIPITTATKYMQANIVISLIFSLMYIIIFLVIKNHHITLYVIWCVIMQIFLFHEQQFYHIYCYTHHQHDLLLC